MPASNANHAFERRISLYVFCGWVTLAVIVVALGLLARLPVPVAQGIIAGQMLVFFVVLLLAPEVRDYLFTRDLRLLTLFHVWRIVPGALFLYYYYSLHLLPWSFAVPGGYGDIVVAVTAPLSALMVASSWPRRWKALLLWHFVGFLDLAGVVRAGFLHGRRNPESMRSLTHFPLSLLPAIMVSLTFILHIIAMGQLWRRIRRVNSEIISKFAAGAEQD
jgi:hypothetical protein